MWTKPNDTKNNSIIKRTAIASASTFKNEFNLALNLVTFEYEFSK